MARLPISEFIQERLSEYDSTFEVREGTAFYELFIKPMQYILQPLRDEADDVQEGQSFLRILSTDDPDAYDEETVDDLASNIFVDRIEGGFSSGVARVFYATPVDREWSTNSAVVQGSNGLIYSNPAPYAITQAEMSRYYDNGVYYYDIPVQSEQPGKDTELAENQLVSFRNDPEALSVTNVAPISGGIDRETNTQLIERSKSSIAVRDIVTGKGFNATLFENFGSFLREVYPVGFGDPEMMRDIVSNVHIGGRVDGYVKTANITQKTQDFIGVLIDFTRQALMTKNVQLMGTDEYELGRINLSRDNGVLFTVRQVKPNTAAFVQSTVDMSSPVDLSVNQYITISVDGTEKTIRVAGITPGQTTRNEIVAIINNAFGVNVATPVGTTLKITSLSPGRSSSVIIRDPAAPLNSAILEVFGLATGSVYTYEGDGPLMFIEGQTHEFDDWKGTLKRILGAPVVTAATGESTAASDQFFDVTLDIFDFVSENDILTINSGNDAGDYRILDVDTSSNLLTLDAPLSETATDVDYVIRQGGIKNGELLYVECYYSPLAIDIGKYVLLDENTNERGIRPDREDFTITDVSFLRVNAIEVIDPVTFEGLGEFLDDSAGFGQGGFGRGPFGVGSKADYRLIVNEPHHRFSAWEDSYINIAQTKQGLSFRVYYDAVTELEAIHDFVRNDDERVLGSDMLIKHFLPAYVSATIQYKVDETDSTIPDNDTLQEEVKEFISQKSAGTSLQASDIIQYITRRTDPHDRYKSYVKPFTMKAKILNADGSTTIISSNEELVVPEPNPFPKDTVRPLSPRISHWVGDEIVMERL